MESSMLEKQRQESILRQEERIKERKEWIIVGAACIMLFAATVMACLMA